jgi:hypothetical protein
LKSKLGKYILDEERNVSSDVASIKKMVKGYMVKTKKLRADLFDTIGKKAISMSNDITENEMEDVKYQIYYWVQKMGEESLGHNIEIIIDAIIEKKY